MLENIRLAFQGIWAHKMRSVLTMLGIIIGIASIIAIASTILGTNEQIKNNLIGAGNNAVKISLYQGDSQLDLTWSSVPDGVPPVSTDTLEKIRALKEVEAASAYYFRSAYDTIYFRSTSLDGGNLLGIDDAWFDVYGYRILRGRGFSRGDYTSFRKVVIVDKVTASSLFQDEDPLGQTLMIAGEPFTVIGVAGQSSSFMPVINSVSDYNTYMDTTGGKVFVPSAAWSILYRFDEPANVVVRATSTDDMTQAGKQAAELLNAALSVSSDAQVEYRSEDQLEQARQLQELSGSTSRQLIWIAAISLLVGGIGVMNIMLVSVTERTREIGLKKALGARKSFIAGQFLTEAAVLTFLGGLLGVLAGIGLAFGIGKISSVPVAISGPICIAAVAFSIAVGVAFGILPAVKASNLNPIDALRHE